MILEKKFIEYRAYKKLDPGYKMAQINNEIEVPSNMNPVPWFSIPIFCTRSVDTKYTQ